MRLLSDNTLQLRMAFIARKSRCQSNHVAECIFRFVDLDVRKPFRVKFGI